MIFSRKMCNPASTDLSKLTLGTWKCERELSGGEEVVATQFGGTVDERRIVSQPPETVVLYGRPNYLPVSTKQEAMPVLIRSDIEKERGNEMLPGKSRSGDVVEEMSLKDCCTTVGNRSFWMCVACEDGGRKMRFLKSLYALRC